MFSLLSAPSWRTVIGVSDEAVSALLQLLVDFIEQHVGEQG
jgi:hypothetical protein